MAATTVPPPQTDRSLDDLDVLDPDLWESGEIDAVFARLRDLPGLHFNAEHYEPYGFPDGPGFWSLVRHADVVEASRHPDLFVSGQGTNIPDMPPEFLEFFGSMINMDAPRHTKMRLIVNRGFTPRMVARVEDSVRERAKAIVDRVTPLGECDFVTEVAGMLPLAIICDLMGIPESEHRWIFDQSNVILGSSDPEYADSIFAALEAGRDLTTFAMDLAQQRLDDPTDDITSALIHAEVDGERLTTQELGSFFVLLVVAGNETTRNAISHGLLAMSRNPEQREAWLADWDGVTDTAVEEIVRWATPVVHFRRTAVEDVEIGGQQISAGDKVVLWYRSANRDAAAFADPYRFDLRRDPNEHIGFGGGGPHFCLGAHLARREIRVLFEELLPRLPDIEVTGEPAMLRSSFIHGIKHLPVAWTPPAG